MGYRGQVIPDWGRFEKMGGVGNKAARNLLLGAVQAFVLEPVRYKAAFTSAAQAFANTGDKNLAMQAFAEAGDFPTSVLEVMQRYQQLTYFDTGYEQVFNMLDFRNTPRNGFDILDVTDGLSFKKVVTGEKAQIYKMSGAKVSVTFDMYGGGLGWDRKLFDDREYWNLENNAIAFRNKAYSSKAQDFYDLIDAVAATYDLAWQAVTPAAVPNTDKDYNAIRDINTINKACENILTNCKNLGFGVNPNSEFIILAPIQFKTRLPRALGIVQQPFAGSTAFAAYNTRIVYTMMLADSTKYYVILPKQKIVGATRMDLTIFSKFDPESYSDIAVGWQRYGGAIAEIKQIVRCSSS
jgi:hypothetical protein